ncbi:hypothetical protein DCS_00877 [Drechmeria coniospora]|uniref:Uncharacterized protein n=1 Tax=Drechmeria coniospora TaxID=98403 RepID=A0A151GRM5_DRECN|nr:hypothetical protein DCS_00877 [Drechmeria coniospora]KYK59743.1 hypothetical protein DCS_00877 [Drechmeria coniospora]
MSSDSFIPTGAVEPTIADTSSPENHLQLAVEFGTDPGATIYAPPSAPEPGFMAAERPGYAGSPQPNTAFATTSHVFTHDHSALSLVPHLADHRSAAFSPPSVALNTTSAWQYGEDVSGFGQLHGSLDNSPHAVGHESDALPLPAIPYNTTSAWQYGEGGVSNHGHSGLDYPPHPFSHSSSIFSPAGIPSLPINTTSSWQHDEVVSSLGYDNLDFPLYPVGHESNAFPPPGMPINATPPWQFEELMPSHSPPFNSQVPFLDPDADPASWSGLEAPLDSSSSPIADVGATSLHRQPPYSNLPMQLSAAGIPADQTPRHVSVSSGYSRPSSSSSTTNDVDDAAWQSILPIFHAPASGQRAFPDPPAAAGELDMGSPPALLPSAVPPISHPAPVPTPPLAENDATASVPFVNRSRSCVPTAAVQLGFEMVDRQQQHAFLDPSWVRQRAESQQADIRLLRATMDRIKHRWATEKSIMRRNLGLLKDQIHRLRVENLMMRSAACHVPDGHATSRNDGGGDSVTGVDSSPDSMAARLSPVTAQQAGSFLFERPPSPPGSWPRHSPIPGSPCQYVGEQRIPSNQTEDVVVRTVVDVSEIYPELDGIPIRLATILRPTFQDTSTVPSGLDSAVAPAGRRSPSARCLTHDAPTSDCSVMQESVADDSSLDLQAGSAAAGELLTSRSIQCIPSTAQMHPSTSQQEVSSPVGDSIAVPDVQYVHGGEMDRGVEERGHLEPTDDVPLRGPLMMQSIPADDDLFMMQLNERLASISGGQGAVPYVLQSSERNLELAASPAGPASPIGEANDASGSDVVCHGCEMSSTCASHDADGAAAGELSPTADRSE